MQALCLRPRVPEDESHLESPPPPRINLTLLPYVFQATKEHPSEKLNGKGVFLWARKTMQFRTSE